MDISMRWKMNDSLYGPNRLIINNSIKDVMLKDHVLQKGEWDAEAKRLEPWTTTTSNNFKKPLPALNDSRRKVKSLGRDASSLFLGSSSNCKLPTTSKDFDRKWLDTPKKAQPDLGTSIPDFATKYLANKKIGNDGSIYSNSYNEAKKMDTSECRNERKEYAKDLRTTHFNFGDTRSKYDTETTYRFQPSTMLPDCPASISSNIALETHKSNVFREGDWNVLGDPCLPNSVTRNDFRIKPFTLQDIVSRNDRACRLSLPRQGSSKLEGGLLMPIGQKIYKAITAKLGSKQKKDPLTVIVHHAITQYDTDRSGCITKDQLKTMISEYLPSVLEEEINTLVTESNSGKPDGAVDYIVLAKYIDSFSNEAEERPYQSIQQESYTGTHYIKTCYPNTSHPNDNPSHPYYHISTHFQLGDYHDQQKSVYHKDYLVKDPCFKPLQALPPLSSQVLPDNNELYIQKSTKQSDYVYHGREGRVVAEARQREMKKNQNRIAKQSIELGSDPTIAQAYRQASVSGKDFSSPPAEFRPLTPRRAPRSQYRHLETNDALLVPTQDNYTSEKQDKFKNQGSLTMCKEKNVECLERTDDNRSSHFILGADSEPKSSEQHHQFSEKTPVDSSMIPAAGKKQTADQNYSHIYLSLINSESAESTVISKQSTVKDNVTATQKRLKEMNEMSSAQTMNMAAKPFTTMDSHYFHYDYSKEKPRLTTTGHDFSRPDRLGVERRGLSIF